MGTEILSHPINNSYTKGINRQDCVHRTEQIKKARIQREDVKPEICSNESYEKDSMFLCTRIIVR